MEEGRKEGGGVETKEERKEEEMGDRRERGERGRREQREKGEGWGDASFCDLNMVPNFQFVSVYQSFGPFICLSAFLPIPLF